MNHDFSRIVKQILQTDDLPIQQLEDLLAEWGCNVKVELHVIRGRNTIVLREQLAQSNLGELELYSESPDF